ncbi:hypothetical protein GCM10017779_12220 [Streptomyces capillispiralis]|uniref:Uncharacterized protein n=1 Tax=Streptomyces capillispiralis TaxID=68182 RepID=A0A561TI72_9ACTN|nr:hypothetical protein FHX78_113817 [Streptomyces capillispiralis]GHH90765.1 hypothetical protein GCM10017779_12220 [Streptomyces capillispiralis]
MTDPIGRLVTWVSVLLRPRGAHRRTGVPRPLPSLPPAAPAPPRLPSPRSPYGLHPLLDGAETVAVRPYVGACWFQGRRAA